MTTYYNDDSFISMGLCKCLATFLASDDEVLSGKSEDEIYSILLKAAKINPKSKIPNGISKAASTWQQGSVPSSSGNKTSASKATSGKKGTSKKGMTPEEFKEYCEQSGATPICSQVIGATKAVDFPHCCGSAVETDETDPDLWLCKTHSKIKSKVKPEAAAKKTAGDKKPVFKTPKLLEDDDDDDEDAVKYVLNSGFTWYNSMAFTEENGKKYCIGKLPDKKNVTVSTKLPSDFKSKLVEPDSIDKKFLKEKKITYKPLEEDDDDDEEEVLTSKFSKKNKQSKKAESDDDDDEEEVVPKSAPKKNIASKPAVSKTVKKDETDDEDEEEEIITSKTVASKSAKPAVSKTVSSKPAVSKTVKKDETDDEDEEEEIITSKTVASKPAVSKTVKKDETDDEDEEEEIITSKSAKPAVSKTVKKDETAEENENVNAVEDDKSKVNNSQ